MKPSYPELLKKASLTGLSDREIEKRVPLPQGFLSKARRGANEGARAEPSWEKLAAWVESWERGQSEPPPRPEAAEPPAPAPAPASLPRSPEDAVKRAALVAKMRCVKSLEDLGIVNADILAGLAEGWISGTTSQRMLSVVDSQRKTLSRILEERARSAPTEPVRIEIVYVEDWRSSPAPVIVPASPPPS